MNVRATRPTNYPSKDFQGTQRSPENPGNTENLAPETASAIAILRDLRPVTGGGRHTFPAIGGGGRPLSENTLNGALRRLGYSGDQMTAHGFRSIASTLLNERGVHPDLIELQLAHAERNKVLGGVVPVLRRRTRGAGEQRCRGRRPAQLGAGSPEIAHAPH